jgi:chemotaxis protein MotB
LLQSWKIKVLRNTDDSLNPYIALADLTINLVFVFVFMIAAILVVGEISHEREQRRYKKAQEVVAQAVSQANLVVRPQVLSPNLRNDPPGAQRWVFSGRDTRGSPLFKSFTSPVLTERGRQSFLAFAQVLQQQIGGFRRIRIEGHTIPPKQGDLDNWDLSAQRSAAVANLFAIEGRIPPYYLAVAARGGQVLFNGPQGRNADPANDRVEIVIEYNQR